MNPLALILRVSVLIFAGEANEVPQYEAELDASAETITTTLCISATHGQMNFLADSEWAKRFIIDIERSSGRELFEERTGWSADDWQAGECIRYQADLGKITAEKKPDVGWRVGNDLVSAPQLWLLRPDIDTVKTSELRMTLPAGWSISAPWLAAPGLRNRRFFIPSTPANWSANVAFGHFNEKLIILKNGQLRISILGGLETTEREKLIGWLRQVSKAALSAYGKLPIDDVQVMVIPIEGPSSEAVAFGQSTRGQGNGLQLLINAGRPGEEFSDDWKAVHELSHLFHPYLGDRDRWISEGLASYYQNVLRARIGLISPEQAWSQLSAGFQRGSAEAQGERLDDVAQGMRRSHAFMRVYWSGAAYWLNVDEEVRRTSHQALSADEALRRFSECCLPSRREWTAEDFLKKLDSLIATHIFLRRYREFGAMKSFPDMISLYRKLGINMDGPDVKLTSAPESAIRDAIMATR